MLILISFDHCAIELQSKQKILIISNANYDSHYRNCAGTQTLPPDFENNGKFNFNEETELDDEKSSKKSNFAWFKRILKFALPVQFFVMMMLFLAWNATDHHHSYFSHNCEGSSRFQFLYPQLKYINGPPPI